ncbi:DNA repair protein RecN [Oceanicella sp. SM1341]|uniref:DNA repair protein RecN n=1 Tax=Oceanicella sp. SM1341 TaxID=1548889 RepID=UPI000E471E91|nr:DNA repair protein RecN [Oceanicella sp. SM1341]
MLHGLTIRDIVLIEALDLGFRPGLNVLTGETGAGKSILLDALGFALGGRGRGSLLREGAASGSVTAEFDLEEGHPARAILAEAGLPAGDELILRRQIDAQGRSRAFVNDARCGAEVLRALADTLIEIHGQQDDRGLLDPRNHRALLDQHAGAAALVEDTRAAWRGVSAARRALSEARAAQESAAADADYLRHAVAELAELDPQPGEEEALDIARRRMQGAERIREDVARAAEALGPSGAEGLMGDASRWLSGAADGAEGDLDEALDALERALTELGEAQQGVERALTALDFSPQELELAEERLFALRGLARKHRVMPDQLPELAEALTARLAMIEGGEESLAALERAVTEAEALYDRHAGALSRLRAEAAGRLDAEIVAELAPLKLERARFVTAISPAEPGPEGRDEVVFTVSTNPGTAPGPLNRIASGGELSRFLLALKVCLAARSGGLPMVFDEIDRGVGGATAAAVGRRLEALAEGGQVMVVTHSPQVAARGAHHWRIRKSVEGGQTRTAVEKLDAEERGAEIARMLSGETVTPEALAAARALIES